MDGVIYTQSFEGGDLNRKIKGSLSQLTAFVPKNGGKETPVSKSLSGIKVNYTTVETKKGNTQTYHTTQSFDSLSEAKDYLHSIS